MADVQYLPIQSKNNFNKEVKTTTDHLSTRRVPFGADKHRSVQISDDRSVRVYTTI